MNGGGRDQLNGRARIIEKTDRQQREIDMQKDG